MVKISIIVPMYKVRDYIGKCCDSLFSQIQESTEYIFVNDATPDDSIEILQMKIQQYPQVLPYVKIVEHSQNMGVAEARNTGLNNALGEYIAFVDADDWIEPEMFSVMYDEAVRKSLDIVGCDWYLEYSKTSRLLRQPTYNSVLEGFKAMLRGELRWYLWSFMIRRSFIVANHLNFTRGYNIGEDMAFLMKCFTLAKSYSHVSLPLYHHVLYNENSLTKIDAERQFEIVRHNVDEAISFIKMKYPEGYDVELASYKLNVKFPLLITADKALYELWNSYYTDSHWAIWKNETQSLRNKLLQWFAARKFYTALQIYYKVFRGISKLLYR